MSIVLLDMVNMVQLLCVILEESVTLGIMQLITEQLSAVITPIIEVTLLVKFVEK